MNFVQPIREASMVQDIAAYLKNDNERNYIIFLCGIYTGRRISDILKLKVGDVKSRSHITIREKKTGKQITIEINPLLKRELQNYCKDKENSDYLIKSREKQNKPLNRSTAYNILRKATIKFGLENIGTHTLRKTFGYHFYKQTTGTIIPTWVNSIYKRISSGSLFPNTKT